MARAGCKIIQWLVGVQRSYKNCINCVLWPCITSCFSKECSTSAGGHFTVAHGFFCTARIKALWCLKYSANLKTNPKTLCSLPGGERGFQSSAHPHLSSGQSCHFPTGSTAREKCWGTGVLPSAGSQLAALGRTLGWRWLFFGNFSLSFFPHQSRGMVAAAVRGRDCLKAPRCSGTPVQLMGIRAGQEDWEPSGQWRWMSSVCRVFKTAVLNCLYRRSEQLGCSGSGRVKHCPCPLIPKRHWKWALPAWSWQGRVGKVQGSR